MILEIILLFMAAAGLFEGVRLSKSTLLFKDPVGPGWYLFFMSGLLFACALALLLKQLARRMIVSRYKILDWSVSAMVAKKSAPSLPL